ncbi:hypothetical protein VTI74DRAFT_5197 [Chaetomium olivicolor]
MHGKQYRYIRVKLDPCRPDLTHGDIFEPTPVMLAVVSGDVEKLELMLKERIEYVYAKPYCEVNEERRAVIPLDTREHGFDITALDLAAFQGRLDMVRLLVDSGARVNWTDKPDYEMYCASITAALCGWGANFPISEKQQCGRTEVLRYLLDQGDPVDALSWNPSFNELCLVHFDADDIGPGPFTALWYTIFVIKPGLLPQAQLLSCRGARWAPWTAWGDAGWAGERVNSPRWRIYNQISPREWVLRGGGCSMGDRESEREDSGEEDGEGPDGAQLEAEEAIFKTMMEEGAEKPSTPDELQWVLELVIHAPHCIRRRNRHHPLVGKLYHGRVRYLIGKGTRLDKLDKYFTERMDRLGRIWRADSPADSPN